MSDQTENKNVALPMMGGIQFLRNHELATLRALNKVFVYRRKNDYRKDILSHITTELVESAFSHPDFVGKDRAEGRIISTLNVLKGLKIVNRCDERRNYDEYKQKNEGLEHIARTMGMRSDTHYIHAFDIVLTNKIVKLLHSVNYPEFSRAMRALLGIMNTLDDVNRWHRASEIDTTGAGAGNTDFTSRLINPHLRKEELEKYIEVDRTTMFIIVRLTEEGKKVLEVLNNITKLIQEKNNEIQPLAPAPAS